MNEVASYLHAKTTMPPLSVPAPLTVGETFRIRRGVFKGEVYTVTKLTPDDHFDIVCKGEKFDVMNFNSAQLAEYGYTILEPETV